MTEKMGDAICHSEQLQVWSDELSEPLMYAGLLLVETYDDKVALHSILKDEIKRIVADALSSSRSEAARLKAALDLIIAESAPDTAHAWCQEHLSRCNEIARTALRVTKGEEK